MGRARRLGGDLGRAGGLAGAGFGLADGPALVGGGAGRGGGDRRGPGAVRSARPWPSVRRPETSMSITSSGRSRRRRRFETATRERPTRLPTSSRVRPNSSTSSEQARASSTGFRSSRAMFSITAISRHSRSSWVATTAGTSSRPASWAARQRRSPAISSYVPPGQGRTRIGCKTPRSRTDSESASSDSWSKDCRGWSGLGLIRSTGRRRSSGRSSAAVGGEGRREDRREAAAHAAMC